MKPTPLLLLAGLLAACSTQTPVNSLHMLAPRGVASIAGSPVDRSRLVMQVKQTGTAAHQYALANLTGLTYDWADLTLANATLLATAKTNGVSLTGPTKAQVYAGLRPGTGYTLDVGLRNGGAAGAQVGTGHSRLTLSAGTNTAVVVIDQNGGVSVQASANGNAMGDAGSGWYIVKGDVVTLQTGFAATESGVVRMDVAVSAELYGAATTIASVTTTGGVGCDQFSWNTGATVTTGGATFNPANLVGTATGTQHGSLTFTLYGAGGNEIGRAQLTNVNVIDPASVDLQLQ